jgi:hypothetical protein
MGFFKQNFKATLECWQIAGSLWKISHCGREYDEYRLAIIVIGGDFFESH